jgi:TPR repeat protein
MIMPRQFLSIMSASNWGRALNWQLGYRLIGLLFYGCLQRRVTVMDNIIKVQSAIAVASMLGLTFCLVPVRSISAQDRTAPTFLLQRGDAMLQLGDVSAARLLYTRAAELGSGTAAVELAKTYDPTFLTDHNLRGVKPDPAEATRWYQRAADMGLTEAKERLRNIDMNALAQKR